ncbi:MAG TPA: glycosyltransferase family 39 protein [Aggregatilineaceae bacterium]|nr:glycosyltransferase family 39 protein [Aggregatilineaceae bacterium]
MILIDPVDLIGVLLALAFACPWALILLRGERRSWVVLALTTLALSLGVLTWWMMVLALVKELQLGRALAGMGLVFGVGMGWLLRSGPVSPGMPRVSLRNLLTAARGQPLAAGAALVLALLAALIVFNALYWPFHDDDAVSIYAMQSRRVYQTRGLLVGSGLYEAYPMLLPLSYTYSYMVAGQIDEYLARVMVAALGVGALGAAFVLGRALYDWRVGLSATTLLALTPSFTRWASSGYTDVPVSFFVTLAALFGGWLLHHRSVSTAVLLGIMVGLAAWTKNSALTLMGSLGLWLAYVSRGPGITRRQAGAALGALAVTAGPWYVRNLLLFGHAVPKTVWADQARHTAANLLPLLTNPRLFSVPGVIFTAGLGLALVEVVRGSHDRRDRASLLLIVVLPFGAAWWWLASYDTRFLLAVLPVVAVMGGHLLVQAEEAVWGARRPLRPAYQAVLLVALVALALPAMSKAVMFKRDILRDPLMSDEKRHEVSLGPIYNVAQYLNALPAQGTVLSDNYFLPFHVEQAGRVEVVVGGLPRRENLALYTYLVYSPGHRLQKLIQASDVRLLADIQGYRVYQVLYR